MLAQFFESQFFQQLGLFGLFIYSALPAFLAVLPNEIISAPLMIGGMGPVNIILVMSVGGTAGDLLMFYIGKYIRKIFHKKVKPASYGHFLHKHRYWIFVITMPVPYLSESIMLISGHQHLDVKRIIPFIYLGELLRSVIGTLIVLGILTLPQLLQ